MSEYEDSRTKQILTQKKTFTKWMNAILEKEGMEIDDIFTDLSDGRTIMKLLEIISNKNKNLEKPNNGKSKVHKIENVNKCLIFLRSQMRLENIGAEDIVDGNKCLILSLIWSIISRFYIENMQINVHENSGTSVKRSAKEELLRWCQRKVKDYPHVNIKDFTKSWRSGMAFNALIHAHYPDIIDYNALNPHNHIENLNFAFDSAQNELGISKLFDAEDIDTDTPDKNSVLTYVSSYYRRFTMNAEMKSENRRNNFASHFDTQNLIKSIDDLRCETKSIKIQLNKLIQKMGENETREFELHLREKQIESLVKQIQELLNKNAESEANVKTLQMIIENLKCENERQKERSKQIQENGSAAILRDVNLNIILNDASVNGINN